MPVHLGELTRLVPFEMVDDVLAMTRRTESRVRLYRPGS
ncbi:transposase domain-containing protein [Micromonospora sp. NBC_00362]|nr:transposase domain-containing protein [Micromonospora sp. NBC_00362]